MRDWRVWAVVSAVLAITAEALNIVAPETIVLQWVVFVPAIPCFVVALTLWDRRRRSR